MIPAYDNMVILSQNPSTANGQIPGCSFILSVLGRYAGIDDIVTWGPARPVPWVIKVVGYFSIKVDHITY